MVKSPESSRYRLLRTEGKATPAFASGPAGLDSTVDDLLAIGVMMLGDCFDTHGFAFGMSVVTRAGGYSGAVGTFGWDGGHGTSWYCDPREGKVSILMTQAMRTSPAPPNVAVEFRTCTYQALDD